jgi:hypothetical protein
LIASLRRDAVVISSATRNFRPLDATRVKQLDSSRNLAEPNEIA